MKKVKLLTIILVIGMLAIGCNQEIEESTNDQTSTSSAIKSDHINLTMVTPSTLNPILNQEASVGYVMELVYDGLFEIDEDYNISPKLAEEYGVSQDGMSIDIKLKDAVWHDGTPVTSSDVQFTVDLIQSNPNSPYSILAQNISNIKIRNDKEFTVEFMEVYPFSLETLIFPIVSRNDLIGNGPYKVESYEERQGMVLTANEDYYEDIESETKGVNIEIVPDKEAQVSMVIALKSDISTISLNDLSKLHEEEFNVTNYEGRDYESIIFNYENPYLNDINFRKAIMASIDREKILEEAYMGYASLVDFPLNTNSKYYNKDMNIIEYNIEKAKEYLQDVEPVSEEQPQDNPNLDDEEEIEESIEGVLSDINLNIIVNKENTERLKSANIIQSGLKSIGIESTINDLTPTEMNNALEEKEYDLALVGWELPSVPDARSIIQSSGYSDEKLINYNESLLSATSTNQIAEIYNSIQQYVNDNVVMVSLVIRDDYIVTNRRLEGEIRPNKFDVYEGIFNLKIKE